MTASAAKTAAAPTETEPAPPAERWRFLAVTCLAVVCALTTWFSATAIIPELEREWSLSATGAAWMTNGVQLGFVIGALGASFVNLPDLVRLNRLMAGAAVLAAAANAVLLLEPSPPLAIAARIVTGMALAGVYPPAMKLMATWFRRGRGFAMGLLIGALTLGSSLPHLFRAATTGFDWRYVVVAASCATLVGAAIFAFGLREGPYAFSRATFHPRQCLAVFRNRPLMLANLGYFGHMWELYAMWGWFLAFSVAAAESGLTLPVDNLSLLSFLVVAVGVAGCILGGVLSDRIGRTLTTTLMMVVSGACGLLIGFTVDGPGWLFVAVALLWGVSIVGDSAQFSTAITELSDQRFVGTALALQMGIGFGLTVIAIWLIPVVAEMLGGWQWSFLVLVPGPVVGATAMLILRRRPEAVRMAHGLR
ncbi:hypothetical protein C882_3615 [Caenispirillum salinarum AK4]|uniref:Major facilitator superfamily (MFS) profile domain-containing protein n=1 Tax=Caenispirillum salinarum AK4 TaxID=1238182 RepID=K9HNF4_9PROT|nr:MFS transporter [Caenispirillum salinarum]EKV31863.1 hypothetical protein C882_3615 [Caenispirillum salinarum AK4]